MCIGKLVTVTMMKGIESLRRWHRLSTKDPQTATIREAATAIAVVVMAPNWNSLIPRRAHAERQANVSPLCLHMTVSGKIQGATRVVRADSSSPVVVFIARARKRPRCWNGTDQETNTHGVLLSVRAVHYTHRHGYSQAHIQGEKENHILVKGVLDRLIIGDRPDAGVCDTGAGRRHEPLKNCAQLPVSFPFSFAAVPGRTGVNKNS